MGEARRRMVFDVGRGRSAMVRRDLSAHSGVSSDRAHARDRAGFRALDDTISEASAST